MGHVNGTNTYSKTCDIMRASSSYKKATDVSPLLARKKQVLKYTCSCTVEGAPCGPRAGS